MRSPSLSLFTSLSLSLPLCPAIPPCVIQPRAVFKLCGFPCSCGDGGNCNFVPVCKVSTWVALKKVTCTWLTQVFLIWVQKVRTSLGRCDAGLEASWPDSIW